MIAGNEDGWGEEKGSPEVRAIHTVYCVISLPRQDNSTEFFRTAVRHNLWDCHHIISIRWIVRLSASTAVETEPVGVSMQRRD